MAIFFFNVYFSSCYTLPGSWSITPSGFVPLFEEILTIIVINETSWRLRKFSSLTRSGHGEPFPPSGRHDYAGRPGEIGGERRDTRSCLQNRCHRPKVSAGERYERVSMCACFLRWRAIIIGVNESVQTGIANVYGLPRSDRYLEDAVSKRFVPT